MAIGTQQNLPPKQLGQKTPSDTNAVSLVKKMPNMRLHVTSLLVVNTTSGALTYSVFLDQDGTTYDTTTAIAYNAAIAANTTVDVLANTPGGVTMQGRSAGNLAVKSSSASNVTFTAMGFEL